jgi:hypothetical protein
MQKIQFYLVPNRITVTTDLVGDGYITEYKKVYQRKIKLYKGIDNTIEIEVRDAGQRRQNVINYDVVLKFYDASHRNMFTAVGDAITAKPGLLSVTITKELIEKVDPQMLSVAAYLRSNSEEKILYIDSQFDLFGHVELKDGFNDKWEDELEELTVFNWEFDRKQYVSEIGNFGRRINDDYSTAPIKRITVDFEGIYEGTIEAEATRDMSTANSVTWTRIFPTGSNTDWDASEETSVHYEGDWRFVRFKYSGFGPGYGAAFNITVTNGEYSLVSVIHRGQNYRVGDTIVIKGSRLGGDDGINDLTLRVDAINEYPFGSINSVTGISVVSGVAVSQDGYYRNVRGDDSVSSKAIDKIIIRN